MNELRITDGRGRRVEEVAGVVVHSSGGVPAGWASVLNMLNPNQHLLDYGSWQGIAALYHSIKGGRAIFASRFSSELKQVENNISANSVDISIETTFPPQGSYDTVVASFPSSGLEMLVACTAGNLVPEGRLLIPVADTADTSAGKAKLSLYFESVAMENGVWVCANPRNKTNELPWDTVVVKAREQEAELETLPVLFSPGGLDEGSRFMLEEAAIPTGARVLDLGCGWGVVGIVASLLGAGEVLYIDDDMAAVMATQRNLQKNNLAGSVFHSHDPHMLPGTFDVILTNPPYHTDFGVAKTFLEFAARRLRPGGWLYVVVRRRGWYENKIKALFGGCRIASRAEYWLLSARQSDVKKARVKTKTTRKHLKRLQERRR